MNLVDGGQLLVMRRLLDASYFVVAEACKLLSTMCYRHEQVQHEWFDIVERMGLRAYSAQSNARKEAVLASMATFFAHKQVAVHERAAKVLPLDRLKQYLFDSDRLIRDHALDVLEATIRAASKNCVVPQVIDLIRQDTDSADQSIHVAVKLRCMAVLVRAVPENPVLSQSNSHLCNSIASMAMSILQHICNEDMAVDNETLAVDLLEIKEEILLHSNKRTVTGEAARIVREFCRHTLDGEMMAQLEQLLSQNKVFGSPQLFHTVLEAIVYILRLSSQANVDNLQILPSLVANFAIRAPGLKMLLNLALEVLCHTSLPPAFVLALTQSLISRMADVEWEPRDTVLEFISESVHRLGWGRSQTIVEPLIEETIGALRDPEEYVRAAAINVLVVVVSSADARFRSSIVSHPGLSQVRLEELLSDPEAFVKRAAFDLLSAIAKTAVEQQEENREWLHSLSYQRLYQICDDPDFEVRLRCTRLLAQLTRWNHFCDIVDTDKQIVVELQVDSLLLDMCSDSSRYVRQVCLENLRDMRSQCANVLLLKEEGLETASKRRVNHTSSFCEKLGMIDFGQLERSLSTEHLYQEAVDRQVDKELMTEADDVNSGNNILECY
ncbi:hypothetical protein FB639_003844 [Coemansia asiatica]|nr:hypothetical protein FB639_003844 [Coemansia asiatica]